MPRPRNTGKVLKTQPAEYPKSPWLAPYHWKPGQSGNPGGRPVGFAEVQRLCQDASPAAIRKLIEQIDDPDPRVAHVAAVAVLVWGWGKPKEREQEETDLGRKLAAMTPAEREQDARELVAHVRAVARAAREQERAEGNVSDAVYEDVPGGIGGGNSGA